MNDAAKEAAIGNVMYDIGPNLRVNVYVAGDGADVDRLLHVSEAIRQWLAKDERARKRLFPTPAANGAPQRARSASGQPQQRQPQGRSGQQRNPWPPVVVDAVDDDGNPTKGCSYHKKADGAPRPMRLWDPETGLMKCTGKTTKTEDGFCPLFYDPRGGLTPAAVAPSGGGAPVPDDAPPLSDDDIPF